MNPANPLVSIIIVTYNSAEFILDMFESAKNQTYSNIELIITDDNSTDCTIDLCKKWLAENSRLFSNTKLIESKINTGTSANLNRGILASSGDWVKFIAGDDYLYPDCISEFIKKSVEKPGVVFIFSTVARNGVPFNRKEYKAFFESTNAEQYKALLKENILPAPATFIKRETIIKLNGFNEEFRLLDDYPFFLKASKTGIKFDFIEKPLVYYRTHENSTSIQITKFNLKYINDLRNFYKIQYLKDLKENKLFFYYLHYKLDFLTLKLVLLKIIKRPKTYYSILFWFSALYWKLRVTNRLETRQLN
ncbi:MAG: glycosyltransferase [Lacibacter sp.]